MSANAIRFWCKQYDYPLFQMFSFWFSFIIQQALATDADVFSEKELEIKVLQDQIQTLIKENQEYLELLKEAQETTRLQVNVPMCCWLCNFMENKVG